MPRLRKLNCKNPDLNRVQDNIAQAYDGVASSPLYNGVVTDYINLQPGVPLLYAHKLDRIPIGFMVIYKNSASNIWSGAINTLTLELNCDAIVTARLYIF